ncbi:MAG: type III-B CRISPR module RAMP protein Cmr4 [Chloroflexi bacterium]|nr:type III-B CRISPR module RAMP protein Cmr4 [Chloroflexota bacterium]
MFSKAMMIYLLVETPLHAGSGREVGAVDLPIQRERATQYPLVQASGVKGKLRAEAYATDEFRAKYEPYFEEEKAKIPANVKDKEAAVKKAKKIARRKAAKELGIEAVFGPDWDHAEEHAGAVSPGDAKILLFPVRSLSGVFAWITSEDVLARVQRDVTAAGGKLSWQPPFVAEGEALVTPKNDVTAGGKVVLEEYSYSPQPNEQVAAIAEWLAENALPQDKEYEYWRKKLSRSLVILPENDFRDFTQHGTEIVTRIRIEDETKTVAQGALWTEENLPADTLLYSAIYANNPTNPQADVNTAEDVLNFIKNLGLERLQLGGNESVGRGLTAVRYGEVTDV